MIKKVFYLCDGKVPRCMEKYGGKGSPGCFRNGGNCKHTSNPEHAVNFEHHRSEETIWEKDKEEESNAESEAAGP